MLILINLFCALLDDDILLFIQFSSDKHFAIALFDIISYSPKSPLTSSLSLLISLFLLLVLFVLSLPFSSLKSFNDSTFSNLFSNSAVLFFSFCNESHKNHPPTPIAAIIKIIKIAQITFFILFPPHMLMQFYYINKLLYLQDFFNFYFFIF